MGLSPKASRATILAWPRLFIEGVSKAYDFVLVDECRERIIFMPLTSAGKENVDVKKQGAMEVLDLFLSHYGEDDDIFVRMMAWGTLILTLVIWCLKSFDVVEAVL